MNSSELRFLALAALGFCLALAPLAVALPSYTFVVSENGAVLELASFPAAQANESHLVVMDLPSDAGEPVVSGALYAVANNTLLLSRSRNTTALVAFTTSLFTSKQGGEWSFAANLSRQFSQADVIVFLPRRAELLFFSPARMRVGPRNDSLALSWNSTAGQAIYLQYAFENGPAVAQANASTSVLPIPQRGPSPVSTTPFAAFVLITALVLLIAYGLWNYLAAGKKVVPQPTPALLTPGQQNILRTLSDNDAKVVQAIASSAGGEVKRFLLERNLGFAKSSLALSLRRLEQKNIVSVDRALVFQRVRLSDWFKSL